MRQPPQVGGMASSRPERLEEVALSAACIPLLSIKEEQGTLRTVT